MASKKFKFDRNNFAECVTSADTPLLANTGRENTETGASDQEVEGTFSRQVRRVRNALPPLC